MLSSCTRLLCLGLLFAAAAPAATMDWTVSGLMTGSLGAASFTNAAFSITLTYDPSLVTFIPGNGDYYSAGGVPGSVSVAGVGSGTFTSSNLYVWSNPVTSIYDYPCACTGFGYVGSADIFDLYASALNGWNMQTQLSPTTVTWRNPGYTATTTTTAGDLSIVSADLTFQALNSGGSSVPEPAGFALAAIGLAAVALRRRKMCACAYAWSNTIPPGRRASTARR